MPLAITVVPEVAKICLPSVHLINPILLERNVKSSCLFTELRRKLGQLLGLPPAFLCLSFFDSLMLLVM